MGLSRAVRAMLGTHAQPVVEFSCFFRGVVGPFGHALTLTSDRRCDQSRAPSLGWRYGRHRHRYYEPLGLPSGSMPFRSRLISTAFARRRLPVRVSPVPLQTFAACPLLTLRSDGRISPDAWSLLRGALACLPRRDSHPLVWDGTVTACPRGERLRSGRTMRSFETSRKMDPREMVRHRVLPSNGVAQCRRHDRHASSPSRAFSGPRSRNRPDTCTTTSWRMGVWLPQRRSDLSGGSIVESPYPISTASLTLARGSAGSASKPSGVESRRSIWTARRRRWLTRT